MTTAPAIKIGNPAVFEINILVLERNESNRFSDENYNQWKKVIS